MRRANATAVRSLLPAFTLCAFALAGCSREKPQQPQQPLTFEHLPDTTGLSQGAAILQSFKPYRMANGAVRVSGEARLPDSTKLQIAIRAASGSASLAMAQVVVLGGRFESPPLLGDLGPLPAGHYRFEVLAHFDADWQPARVLREIGAGTGLRGPGITRARNGDAALFLAREARL
jgi:hypothetical protein